MFITDCGVAEAAPFQSHVIQSHVPFEASMLKLRGAFWRPSNFDFNTVAHCSFGTGYRVAG
jgi:hypothetical protein